MLYIHINLYVIITETDMPSTLKVNTLRLVHGIGGAACLGLCQMYGNILIPAYFSPTIPDHFLSSYMVALDI